jgi:hypothetical protein
MRNYRKKAVDGEDADQEVLPAVAIIHFEYTRLGHTFNGERFDIQFWGIFASVFIVGIYEIGWATIFLRETFQFTGIRGGRSCANGDIRHISGGCCFLSSHRTALSQHVGCPPDWLLGVLF